MIQRGRGKGFLPETADAVFIFGNVRGEKFKRDPPVQARVFRQINFAHPAFSDQLQNFVMAQTLAGAKFFVVSDNCFRDFADGGLFQKSGGIFSVGKERFDFAAHRLIAVIVFTDESPTFIRRAFHRGIE